MSLRDRIIENINQYGHLVLGVGADPETRAPTFSYTIGLTARFGYELLIVGLSPYMAQIIINDIASKGTVELGVPTTEFTNLPVVFKACDTRLAELHSGYVVQADNFYGKDVDVVQIVMSDREGRLPSDPTYDHAYMDPIQVLFAKFKTNGESS